MIFSFFELSIGFVARSRVLFTQFPPVVTSCLREEQNPNQETDTGVLFQILFRLYYFDTH